jgi:CRISPR-associated protein Csy1
MSNKEASFESWEEVIVEFFEKQISQSKLYKARKYISDKEADIKKEKEEKRRNRLILAMNEKEKELAALRVKAPSTEIRDWIDKNTKNSMFRSGRIIKATHLLKFSHTSSAAEGVFFEEKSEDRLLTTSSLKKVISPDLAHSNGALISVSRFLYLDLRGERIIDLVLNGDYSFFNNFYENKEQLTTWKEHFSNIVIETKEIKTADKAKQLYFPIDSSKKYLSLKGVPYHLITPLFSSSLAEELDQFVNHLRYSEEHKNIKKCQKPKKEDSQKYHITESMVVPNIGIQNYGGEYPRNVSMLNANRQGKSYLFSTQPPSWESQLKPPIYKKSLFDNFASYQINEDIKYLRDFLLRFKHLDLSYKDPKRYAHLMRWVESIIDEVFYYANSIQKLPASWSADKNIKLDIEHQYFLDPYRNDDEFQVRRSTTDWQSIICNDFASWLNRKLAGKEKQFTPKTEHTRLWKKLFEPVIREDCEAIKAEREYNKEESV